MNDTVTSAQRFCPACGAPTPTEPLDERGLCRSCYLKENELVQMPETIRIRRCRGCESLEIDDKWTDNEADLADVAIDLVADRIEVLATVEDLQWEARTTPVDDQTIAVTAELALFLDGGWERVDRRSEVTFEPTVCPRCSRIAGDDFGAIVQLRASDRTPVDDELQRARAVTAGVLEERVAVGDRDSFLTEVVERDEGLDFRLSTPRLGEQVATAIRRDLGGTIETARTLVTTDGDGREVYRVTFTVRLAPYRRGDILASDSTALLVEGGADQVRVLELDTGNRRTVPADQLNATRVGTRGDTTSVTVVARLDDRAVQVLHPDTHATVTVAHYEGVDLDDDTVDAIEVDGELYLLPTNDR